MIFNASNFLKGDLAKLSPSLYFDKQEYFTFDKILFWDGEVQKNILFLTRASNLPTSLPDDFSTLQLVCLEDSKVPNFFLNHPRIKLVTIPPDFTIEQLHNAMIQNCFVNLPKVIPISHIINLTRTGPYSAIVNAISGGYERFVALFDANLRLLAHSATYESRTTKASDFIHFGYYQNARLTDQLKNCNVPVFIPKNGIIIPLANGAHTSGEIFCPIISIVGPKETLGYLYFEVDDAYEFNGNPAALEYISAALSQRLSKELEISRPKSASVTTILTQIFDGILNSNHAIMQALKAVSFQQMKHNLLITVVSTQQAGPSISFENLKMEYENVFPSAFVFPYKASVVILLRSNEPITLSDDSLSPLNETLGKNNCRAGISDVFHFVDRNLKHYYKQTVSAAVGNIYYSEEKYYVKHSDIALYNLVRSSFGEAPKLTQDSIDPRILLLMSLDNENGTEYIKTLRSYWHYSKKIDIVCDYLHIQRSTLFYRIRKIREITNVNINDFSSFLPWSISIAILEYLHELPTMTFSLYEDTDGYE